MAKEKDLKKKSSLSPEDIERLELLQKERTAAHYC
jgi:hypothetical protein